MANKIANFASACSIGIQECAQGMLNPMVLQVWWSEEHGTPDLNLICHSLNGDEVANVTLKPEDDVQMLRRKIADVVDPPYGPASLNIILPGGQLLQDLVPSESVQN